MDAEFQIKRTMDMIAALSYTEESVRSKYSRLVEIIRTSNPLYVAGEFAVHAACHKEEDDLVTLPRVFAYLLYLIEKNYISANWGKGYPGTDVIQEVYEALDVIIKRIAVSPIFSDYRKGPSLTWAANQQNVQDVFVSGKGYYQFRKKILTGIARRFDAAKKNDEISVFDIYAFIEDAEHLINKKLEQYVERSKRLRRKMHILRTNEKFQSAWQKEIGEKNPGIFDVTCLLKDHSCVMIAFSTALDSDKATSDEMLQPGVGTSYSNAPIWNINGRYYLLNFIDFEDNLYAIYVNYLMGISHKTKERFEKIRASYVEQQAIEELSTLTKADWHHGNVKYQYGKQEYETDAILSLDDTLFVVEVKSHKFRAQALKGREKDFAKQLRVSIKEADEQASRFIDALQGREELTITSGKETRIIKKNDYCVYRKIIVIFEDLSPHCASLDNFLQAHIVDSNEIPWVVSLHDLMAIREVVDKPEHFLQYVEMRSLRNMREDLYFHDEMEILGYFLKNGACLPQQMPNDKQFVAFQAKELDKFFNHRAKKPIYKFPPEVATLLTSMADSKLKGWASFTRVLVGVRTEELTAFNVFLRGVVPVESSRNESHSHLFKSENFNVLVMFGKMDDELVDQVKQNVTGVLFVFVCHFSLPLQVIELSCVD